MLMAFGAFANDADFRLKNKAGYFRCLVAAARSRRQLRNPRLSQPHR
jgi:hypothetical protein